MPEVILQALDGAPALIQWYQWGTLIGFVVAIGATIWVFMDAERSSEDATIWKSFGAIASVLCVPALLARMHSGFALEMRDALQLLGYLSVGSLFLAIVSVIAHALTRRTLVGVHASSGNIGGDWQVGGQYPLQPSTIASFPPGLPAGAMPGNSAPTMVGGTGAPEGAGAGGAWGAWGQAATAGVRGEAQTKAAETQFMGKLPPNPASSGRRGDKRTVLISMEPEPHIAFLVFATGTYRNTTLPLKSGVTRIGRGSANDHVIDDDAVSDPHLSIRYQDGEFTITDLDSSNGTLVNGARVTRQVLAPNDVIQLGRTKMVFMKVPESADDESPARMPAVPRPPAPPQAVQEPPVLPEMVEKSGS